MTNNLTPANKCCWGCAEIETSIHCLWQYKMVHFGKKFSSFLQLVTIRPYNSTPRYIPRDLKTIYPQKKLYPSIQGNNVLGAQGVKIIQMSINLWIKKMWYNQTKKNTIQPYKEIHASPRNELENNMLSKRSQKANGHILLTFHLCEMLRIGKSTETQLDCWVLAGSNGKWLLDKFLWGLKNYTVLMTAQHSEHTKKHCTVHLKMVNTCEFYLKQNQKSNVTLNVYTAIRKLPTLKMTNTELSLCTTVFLMDHEESWAPKPVVFQRWCWRRILSPLDYKTQPVNPKENQSWIFIGRTDAEVPILWPPDVKNWLIGKDPDAGKDWG